jgi:hypothetical protein
VSCPPTASTASHNEYTQMFSGSAEAIATVGGRKMPLSDAIAKGFVRVRGPNEKEADAHLERLLEGRSGGGGGGGGPPLVFESLVNEELQIEFRSPTLIGEAGDAAPHIGLEEVSRQIAGKGNVQNEIWATELMTRVGYAQPGDSPAQRAKGIKRLQFERGLAQTGKLDPGTQMALEEIRELIAQNESAAGSYALVAIERTIPPATHVYRLTLPDGRTRLLNDSNKIVETANAAAKASNADTALIVANGLKPSEYAALRTSLRTQAGSGRSRLFMTDEEPAGSLEKYMQSELSKLSLLERGGERKMQASKVTKVPGQDRHRVDVVISGEHGEKASLSIISRSLDILSAFLSRLSEMLASAEWRDRTLLSVVMEAKRDLKTRLKLTDQQLAELRIEIQGTQIALILPGLPAVILGGDA